MLIAQQAELLNELLEELKNAPPPGRRLAFEALAVARNELFAYRRSGGPLTRERELAEAEFRIAELERELAELRSR